MIKIWFCSIALLLTFNSIKAQQTEGTCATLEISSVIVPVLTPFKTNGDVNFDEIEPYAQYLKDNGVSDVLVTGYIGEGASLDLCERIEVIRKWVEVAGSRGIGVIVEIRGGISFKGSLILAELCVELKVKAIALLPEQIYEATTVEEYVGDIERIAEVAVGISIVIEETTALPSSVSFVEVFILASARIPCFAGCITNLNTALNIKAVTSIFGKVLITTGHVVIAPTLQLNLNATVNSFTNIFPELIFEIVAAIQAGDYETADMKQTELNVYVAAILSLTGDINEAQISRSYVEKQKVAMELKTDLEFSIPRLPLEECELEEIEQIDNALIDLNVQLASDAASVKGA